MIPTRKVPSCLRVEGDRDGNLIPYITVGVMREGPNLSH